jgi:Type IV secretion-system coupling protein DNA-binding domain
MTREGPPPVMVFPAGLRTQHLGMLGLSGSGKTYLIEHMIRQDIQNGTGFVVFDVHGDLASNIVGYLAERDGLHPEVYERTVIIEPFDPDRSLGFNPLERSRRTSPFLQAQEFTQILRKRWQEDAPSPRTAELLCNSLYTLSVNDATLLELAALLSEKRVRDRLVARLPPGEVRQYWTSRYDKLSPTMQAVFREPILSRIAGFVTDPQMRDIVGQRTSTISFRDAIQHERWVIINLSKGRLGENSTLLGSMLFTKLELEIMALADVPEGERKFFAVYADELQNLAGDTFERLITEARKYKVALVAGHQFWRQLDPALRHAMLAVGSKVFFRLHYHDAVELAGELAAKEKPRYVRLLTTLGRGEAVIRLGAGRPVVITVPAHRAAKPTDEELRKLREASAARYTTPRDLIHTDEESHVDAFTRDRGNQTLASAETNAYGDNDRE